MDAFSKIIGHGKAVERLVLALTHGMPHALLITGPRHVGKATLALALASALLESERLGTHPNFRLVERQADPNPTSLKLRGTGTKKLHKGIGIEEVRAVRDFLHLSAWGGGRKVAVIDGADILTDEAAAALLKTLEEPPEGSHILLLASEVKSVLPTIRSRAATLALGRAPDADIMEALAAAGEPPDRAADLTAYAAGRPGLALILARDADVLDWYRREERRWQELRQATLHRRFALAAEMAPPKEDREAAIRRLHDVAASWEAALRRELRAGDAAAPARLTALARFRRDLEANVQPRLLLERLMLEFDQPT